MAGIDIGVHRSDRRRRVGKLTRQGSPQLRWALYAAALSACRPSSPDHAAYPRPPRRAALRTPPPPPTSRPPRPRGPTPPPPALTTPPTPPRRSYHALRE